MSERTNTHNWQNAEKACYEDFKLTLKRLGISDMAVIKHGGSDSTPTDLAISRYGIPLIRTNAKLMNNGAHVHEHTIKNVSGRKVHTYSSSGEAGEYVDRITEAYSDAIECLYGGQREVIHVDPDKLNVSQSEFQHMLATIAAEKLRHDNIDLLSLYEDAPAKRLLHIQAMVEAVLKYLDLSCDIRHKSNGSNRITGKAKDEITWGLTNQFPFMDLYEKDEEIIIGEFQRHIHRLNAIQSKPDKYQFDLIGDDEYKLLATMREDGSALVRKRGNDSDEVVTMFIDAKMKRHITEQDEADGKAMLKDMIKRKTFA